MWWAYVWKDFFYEQWELEIAQSRSRCKFHCFHCTFHNKQSPEWAETSWKLQRSSWWRKDFFQLHKLKVKAWYLNQSISDDWWNGNESLNDNRNFFFVSKLEINWKKYFICTTVSIKRLNTTPIMFSSFFDIKYSWTPFKRTSKWLFIGFTCTHVAFVEAEIRASLLRRNRTSDYVATVHAHASLNRIIVNLSWSTS